MGKYMSRRKRFESIMSDISSSTDGLRELQDELQDWLDNIPENLEGGQKAEQLEEAIDELDDHINSLEEIMGSSIEFPGMCG